MKSKEELLEKFNLINQKLIDFNFQTELVIVGGAAFLFYEMLNRSTSDIDILNNVRNEIKMLILKDFEVSDSVTRFEDVFGEWKEDLKVLIPLSNLTVKSISPERLIVSRLFSRRKYDDIFEAIKHIEINKEKFESILLEVWKFAANEHGMFVNEFEENKYIVTEIYEKMGWNYEEGIVKDLYKK